MMGKSLQNCNLYPFILYPAPPPSFALPSNGQINIFFDNYSIFIVYQQIFTDICILILNSYTIMEIKITTNQILKVLEILSWIIFIGLCIEAGGIIFNTIYALNKPIVAKYFWNGTDLSQLYSHDKGYFITQTVLMSIVAVMKALIFYLIIKLFYQKNFNIAKPFNPEVTKVVFNIAYLCLGAGFFSFWGAGYAAWIKDKGIQMPDIQYLRIGGADVWLFMAVVLIVIGQIFKKGTELQTESDLTV